MTLAIERTTRLATCDLTMSETAALYARRELSPIELVEAHLARIAALDPQLDSYLTVTGERARSDAQAAEDRQLRGELRGPLDGMPIAYKDLYATRGVLTTAHSRVLADWVPDDDATAVARLRDAGAVMLGKLAMHEFATGGPAVDGFAPPARNPWNPAHIPGGSSSGSGAALAARLCMGSLGSDTGGSIRGPASLCGIVGLKPTYGRISRYGVVALSWSLDHAGPMTRSVEDCAHMLQCVAGYDPRDPASADVPVGSYTAHLTEPIRGLRLGVPRAAFMDVEGLDPDTRAAVETAFDVFRDLGATLVDVEWPSLGWSAATGLISAMEAFAYHAQTLRERPSAFGVLARNRFRLGGLLSSADYLQAQRARAVVCHEAATLMQSVDALVTPTSIAPASTFESFDPLAQYHDRPSFTRPFNLTGQPALSIPCGFSRAGLPIGLQIAGRPFDEATVLRLGHAYESATDWHTRVPALAAA
jgi:aspartyl-tRNA(Asn)/glutamyl-tRNA(Gln) amidotransferase subunit A